MKAFLLAAGLGTRLRPVTDTMPKCMVPVGGRPLLDFWLEALREAGADEVLVNLHHVPDVVLKYLRSFRSRSGTPEVIVAYEPELLGSAGTILAHRDWVQDEEFFLACNADCLTDFRIGDIVEAHRAASPVATITTHRSATPAASGILEVDSDGVMTSFTEKPEYPASDLANAGIYAFSPSVLDEVPGELPCDIGRDLLPRLTGRTRTVPVTGYFRDIGTPEDYRLAQQEWNQR